MVRPNTLVAVSSLDIAIRMNVQVFLKMYHEIICWKYFQTPSMKFSSDPCYDDPCHNEGVCHKYGHDHHGDHEYYCTCPGGWEGYHCDDHGSLGNYYNNKHV